MYRRSLWFLLILLMTGLVNAQQKQLLAVTSHESSDNKLNFDFLSSAEIQHHVFLLPDPLRLVVDLFDHKISENVSIPAVANRFVNNIRTAQHEKDLRLVFDFDSDILIDQLLIKKNSQGKLQLQLNVEKHINKSVVTNQMRVAASADEVKNSQTNNLFSDWDISGKIAIEELGFFHSPLHPEQHNNYISGMIQPEFYREWDNARQSFTFVPFFRYSQHDNQRTHFDIRELTWLMAEQSWEMGIGFRKVHWGVAEGLHLVDIINQTDFVENTDTEDKFGQPMINLALINDWGTWDIFVMPGFRERSYPGVEGRLRNIPKISVGEAEYEKHGIEKHMAYAFRWSQVLGDWDIGFSHFYGTSREPSFRVKLSGTGELLLTPYYDLINQTGLDVQYTHEDWIYKYEGIVREGQGGTYYAMTTGIEYTWFDIMHRGLDLGLVIEYMYDTRGSKNLLAPFQDDILVAARFAFNDVQSTEILAGIMFDRQNDSKFYNIEASRRLGDSFKIELEMRIFSAAPSTDASYSFREDDHIRLELGYYF